MSAQWVQTVTAWGAGGTGPQNSGSFTPIAGNCLIAAYQDVLSSGRSFIYTGPTNTLVEGVKVNDTTNGNTAALAGLLNIIGGSQILTADSVPTGTGAMEGAAVEYSGVTALTYDSTHPLGTATPAGNPVVVPVDSTLLGFCTIKSGAGTAITPSTNGGVNPTNRGSGLNSENYCWGEWIGIGGSITPTFSGASANYIVLQVLLTGNPDSPPPILMGQACL